MSLFSKINLTSAFPFLLFLYPALMFFPFAFSNIAYILTIAFFIWRLFTKQINMQHFKNNLVWYLIIISPFILTLISAIHSKNISRGFEFVFQRLPIVIYPFLFLAINPNKKTIQLGFKIIIFFTTYGIIHSWIKFLFLYPNTFLQFNHYEVQQSTIIQHPYLGMMSLFSLILLIYLTDVQKFSKYLLSIIILILISGIVLSTSRLAIILLVIIGLFFIFRKFNSTYRWFIGGFFVLGILTFITQTSVMLKFTNEFTFEKSPRLLLWNNALQLIKSSESILGIGIGDYYNKKIDTYWFLGEYQNNKYNFRGLYGYECHNLYVENILLTGILGLFFIAGIGIIFIYLLKQKNELNLILFLLLASFMFTETLLLRQWGIIFYVFILSLSINSNTNLISYKKKT